MKAREQLSLLDLADWIVGQRVSTKVCGADDGELRPIVCRVQLGPSLSDQGKIVCVRSQKLVALSNP